MPVQVRHEVSQTGEIDLVRSNEFAYRTFRCEYNVHEVACVGGRKGAHFIHMISAHDTTETRKRIRGRVSHPYHTT